MKQNNYHIQIESHPPYPKKLWQEILVSCLNILQEKKDFSFENCTLNLLVVKDSDMIFHNHEQMSVYGPTNILSFPENENHTVFIGKGQHAIQKQRSNLGTLILSSDTLLREAFLYGQDPTVHATRLLAHGLIHLLGYDHGNEMWELTNFLEEHVTIQQLSYTITPIWSF